MREPPAFLTYLVERFDSSVFDGRGRRTRIRLAIRDGEAWDALISNGSNGSVSLTAASDQPDAILTADADTWERIAADLRGGMDYYRASRLSVRRNLHAGVAFLAATSGSTDPHRLRFRTVRTASCSS